MRTINAANEARHYWRLAQNIAALRLHGSQPDEMHDWIDELEVLRDMTDWPLLKERCSDLLAELSLDKVKEQVHDRP